jgi:hypothetical protein
MPSNWCLAFWKQHLAVLRSSFVETLRQRTGMWSLIHCATCSCFRNSICDARLCVRNFFLCTQLSTPLTDTGDLSLVKTRHTLYLQWQDILLLKGTKHQLSVYDKMPMVIFSWMPVLHFSSVSAQFKDYLKNKINKMHELFQANKYR